MKKLIVATLFLSSAAFGATATLDSELDSLAIPADKGITSTASDKVFAIQSRFSPLANRHELGFSAGKNLNIDGHLESNQWGGLYRYHITDRWAMGLNYFKVNNELSSSGKKLVNDRGILPDRDYLKSQTDVMAEYNLFYGKMRFDLEKVVYFDQYIAVGAGSAQLGSGNATAYVLDAGFAFWFGKRGGARIGLKNDFYTEKNLNGSTNVHNMVGYLSFSLLLGGEK